MELKHILMNLSVSDTPAVIIVRVEPMRWRQDVLPVIKAVAEDVAGRKVRWADIHVFESLGNTPEEGELEWLGFVERKTQVLYRSDRPGHVERVN